MPVLVLDTLCKIIRSHMRFWIISVSTLIPTLGVYDTLLYTVACHSGRCDCVQKLEPVSMVGDIITQVYTYKLTEHGSNHPFENVICVLERNIFGCISFLTVFVLLFLSYSYL